MNDKFHKLFLALLFISVVVACNTKDKNVLVNKLSTQKLLQYSKINNKYIKCEQCVLKYLKNKNIEFLADIAKWDLYNRYFNYKISMPLDTFYLSFCDLRAKDYVLSKDERFIDISYDFIYNDSINAKSYLSQNQFPLADGVTLDIKKKMVVKYFIHGGSFKILYDKVLQSEKEAFFNRNWKKMNWWYKKQILNHES